MTEVVARSAVLGEVETCELFFFADTKKASCLDAAEEERRSNRDEDGDSDAADGLVEENFDAASEEEAFRSAFAATDWRARRGEQAGSEKTPETAHALSLIHI